MNRRRGPGDSDFSDDARHRGTSLPVPLGRGSEGLTRERPGAEGSERIAPPERPPQGDSAILPPGIGSNHAGTPLAVRDEGRRGPPRPPSEVPDRLTLPIRASYHPPDDERAYALTGARRVCVPLGVGLSTRGGTERISHSPDDEADLPAQEAPSREGARISRPDANLRRPSRDRSPAGSRSEAADGLTNDRGQNPPRLVMLSRPQDFAALQGSGTSRSHPLFSARFLRTDLESTRFGLSTGRKLGGAVVRNRVRRRLREVLRAMAPSFQPGWDVLIIARPAIIESDHEALVGALRRLLQRGGVLGGPTAT
jgi:ribonuclease P protein component